MFTLLNKLKLIMHSKAKVPLLLTEPTRIRKTSNRTISLSLGEGVFCIIHIFQATLISPSGSFSPQGRSDKTR